MLFELNYPHNEEREQIPNNDVIESRMKYVVSHEWVPVNGAFSGFGRLRWPPDMKRSYQ